MRAELDKIAARYEAQFAGQSRATRNLDELDALRSRLADACEEGK